MRCELGNPRPERVAVEWISVAGRLAVVDEGVLMTHSVSTAESALPPLTSGPHRKRIGLISVVACFGGLLFGYDTGVTNGAERPMQAELGLSDLSLGIVISSLI